MDVILTAIRHTSVASTLERRHFDIMCAECASYRRFAVPLLFAFLPSFSFVAFCGLYFVSAVVSGFLNLQLVHSSICHKKDWENV